VTYFRGSAAVPVVDDTAFFTFSMLPAETPRFPLSFFEEVVNQPMFGHSSPSSVPVSTILCDSMLRLFDTPLTTGAGFEPVAVAGTVRSNLGPFEEGEHEYSDVHGFHVASAFIERNYIPCDEIPGWQ
jgi:hypothetical protein